jgi:flagellar biosynthesis anti-sigma factor FlgM
MEIRSPSLALQPLEPVGTVKSADDSAGPGTPGKPGQPVEQDVASLMLGQALSGDDTRVGRVQALQGQIANGSYEVSAQAVATKLLDSMAEGS